MAMAAIAHLTAVACLALTVNRTESDTLATWKKQYSGVMMAPIATNGTKARPPMRAC